MAGRLGLDLFAGSVVPALLWGVAFANMVKGVPINAAMQYTGGFWNLLNPFALLAGLLSLIGFTLHGAIFLTLKTSGSIHDKAKKWSQGLWAATLIAATLVTIGAFTFTGMIHGLGWNSGLLLLVGLVLLIALRFSWQKEGKDGPLSSQPWLY